MIDIMRRDSFSLVKKDSDEKIEGLQGSYSLEKKKISIMTSELDVDAGDIVVQHLPGAKEKRFRVKEWVFHNASPRLTHYSLIVEPIDQVLTTLGQQVTYTVNNYGTTTQINQNSAGATVSDLGVQTVIQELEEVLSAYASELKDRKAVSQILRELSSLEKTSPAYKEKLAKFLELTANVMTVISPFLPRLF